MNHGKVLYLGSDQLDAILLAFVLFLDESIHLRIDLGKRSRARRDQSFRPGLIKTTNTDHRAA